VLFALHFKVIRFARVRLQFETPGQERLRKTIKISETSVLWYRYDPWTSRIRVVLALGGLGRCLVSLFIRGRFLNCI